MATTGCSERPDPFGPTSIVRLSGFCDGVVRVAFGPPDTDSENLSRRQHVARGSA
jgi:hypothetical protein